MDKTHDDRPPEGPSPPSPASAADWALEGSHLPGGRMAVSGTVVIGRSEDCDLVIPEPYLSRRHVSIRVADGCLEVEDLGSANGTFLNGERIDRAEASNGDEIRLDRLVFNVLGPVAPDREATVLRDPEATALHVASLDSATPGPDRTRVLGRTAAQLVPDGPQSTERIDVKPGSNRLGRAPDNDIVLDDPSVSSYHARLLEQQGEWMLEDLGSTNGTYVDDRRVTEARLDGGCKLRFGDLGMKFVPEGAGWQSGGGPVMPAAATERHKRRRWLWLLVGLLILCGVGTLVLLQRLG